MRRLTVILILFASASFGQKEETKNAIIEKRVEYLLETAAENNDLDFQTLFDGLLYFYDHPLNLNHSTTEELEELGLLTDIQINALLSHIKDHGKLIRLEELQTIRAFDAEVIRLIMPFIKIAVDQESNPLVFSEILNNGKHTVLTRYIRVLEEQEGFSDIDDSTLTANPNKRYLGSPDKLYFRYRYQYSNRLSIGLTAEKDAGEEFFRGTQKNGFDYYSFHAYARDLSIFKHLVIGDYQAQFGQGLTFWSGYSFGKSAEVMLVKRQAQLIRPYTSVDENQFLRGAASTVKAGKILLTTFYSRNRLDANVSSDTLENELSFTSLQNSGIHGTPAQLEDKDAITQTVFGANATYRSGGLTVGLTGVNNTYGGTFTPRLTTYSQFRLDTNTVTNVGFNYNYVVRNLNFFGEFAQSVNAGGAMVNGMIATLDPRFSVVVLHRSYTRDYHMIASAAIAENSRVENETGTYIGIEARPARAWRITAYYDQFRFPWLKYQVDGPSRGFQYLGQITWKPSKQLEIYGRIRSRIRDRNARLTQEGIDALLAEEQTNYRLNLTVKVTENVKLKSRAEWVRYKLGNEKDETGFLIYQDLIYQKAGFPLRFVARYGLFDTDSYDSRIYTYENDVLYYFSIPAYYSQGMRTYLMARYDINRSLKLWVRWAQYYYQDRDVISSGLNQIDGNVRSELKVQLLMKL